MSPLRLILVPLLLLTTARAADPVVTVPALTTILRPQRVQVELLRIALPAEVQAIADRVSAAVKDRPEWYVNLNDATPEGEDLPYDRRFGVTQAEYDHLRTTRPQVTVTGHSTLTIANGSSPGSLTLRGGPGLEALIGLNLLRSSNGTYHVTTRVGTTGGQRAFMSSATALLGAQSGYARSLGGPGFDRLNDQYALLRVGLLREGGQLVIQYRLYEDQDGTRIRDVDLTVRTVGYRP